MRLGISTLLIVALASAGLAACGDSDTGSGGGGGAGGGVTSGGGNDAGTGGSDTGTGGDAGTGGAAPQECTVELVEPDGVCDEGCDGSFSSDTAKLCTFSCSDAACPDSPEGTFECITDGANSVCGYTCAGGDACPNGFICDQEICFPDTPDT